MEKLCEIVAFETRSQASGDGVGIRYAVCVYLFGLVPILGGRNKDGGGRESIIVPSVGLERPENKTKKKPLSANPSQIHYAYKTLA